MAEAVSSVLAEIVAARRKRVEEAKSRLPLDRLRAAAEARVERRDFAAAIAPGRGERGALRVIAELKRASPSRGLLRAHYRRREIAQRYEAAGAAALSVLTEEDYFLGSLEDLEQARAAVRLPVLRKDFIFDPYQVYESAAAGADAILLIVGVVTGDRLGELLELAARLGMAALVEVHTEQDLDWALAASARIVGVNNRNLKTMEVNLDTSLRLRKKIPAGCVAVSESGIKTPADLERLAEAGYDAVLIGEHLMLAPDPGRALQELVEATRQKAIGSRP